MPLTRHSQDRLRTARPSGYVWEVSDMQKTQQLHEELVRTDVLSPEMKTLMENAIHTLETCPDQAIMERHRDGD
ncbi:TPA: hypothetical protein JD264_18570 [Serratia fonticola]|nr:hypothetical protein [Serratia fonticola]